MQDSHVTRNRIMGSNNNRKQAKLSTNTIKCRASGYTLRHWNPRPLTVITEHVRAGGRSGGLTQTTAIGATQVACQVKIGVYTLNSTKK